MPVKLTINDRTTEVPPGETSLFHIAESLGVQVPTSCRTNGKCKECMVEVVEGMDALSPPTPAESHLRGAFRLSCQTHTAVPEGEVRCHTMRRGQLRIERHAYDLPTAARLELEPAVTRDGDRILIDGVEVERSTGPIHGIAMDLGTTTIVLEICPSRHNLMGSGPTWELRSPHAWRFNSRPTNGTLLPRVVAR